MGAKAHHADRVLVGVCTPALPDSRLHRRFTKSYNATGRPAFVPIPHGIGEPKTPGITMDHAATVALLIAAGADPMAMASEGRSPVEIALQFGMHDAVQLLLPAAECPALVPVRDVTAHG